MAFAVLLILIGIALTILIGYIVGIIMILIGLAMLVPALKGGRVRDPDG